MAITDALLLPEDVLLVPVRDLPAELIRGLGADDDDYALTRPRTRAASKIVDSQSARLLEAFRQPTTVVAAVIAFSRTQQTDPQATLEGAFPLIQSLLHAGVLVPADSDRAARITSSFDVDDEIDGFRVLRCVQVVDDTEVYQVALRDDTRAHAGGAATSALKIARRHDEGGRGIGQRFRHEAAILAQLGGDDDGGRPAPKLLHTGTADDRFYVVMEWCDGVEAGVAAERMRRGIDRASRTSPAALRPLLRPLLGLCAAILRAYEQLHARGVLHTDVHPRNVLVRDDGTVTIVDFGFAHRAARVMEARHVDRAGIPFFFEPEYARAVRARGAHPAPSARGEQYGLGALVFHLLTGAHYVDFSLEQHELMRQIVEAPPVSFASRGLAPWPEVEAVLARALSKDAADRFESVDAFASALSAAAAAEAEAVLARGLSRDGADRFESVEASASALGVAMEAEAAAVLARALNKDGADRFESVEASASARGAAAAAEAAGVSEDDARAPFARDARATRRESSEGDGRSEGGEGRVATASSVSDPARALLDAVIERLDRDGPLFSDRGSLEAPTCSVNLGASGFAYALYRIAGIRQDPELLSLADLWAERAVAASTRPESFENAALDMRPETVGRTSPYHTATGVQAVRALVSRAMGDTMSLDAALAAFVAASDQPCDNLDLTLGRSGTLLIGALLIEASAGLAPAGVAPLVALGHRTLDSLWRELESATPAPPVAPADAAREGAWRAEQRRPIASARPFTFAGIAHGWAGALYATLRWCQASGREVPAGVASRLDELAGRASWHGHAAKWTRSIVPAASGSSASPRGSRRANAAADESCWSGWCAGGAGFVHLWTLAHQQFGEPAHLDLARGAAWHAYEDPDHLGDLCCGLAGRAYALLNVARYTGDRGWLPRARDLSTRAAASIQQYALRRDSLYKGDIGVALLAADLERPAAAAMPFFESEGWPAHPPVPR